MEKESSLPERYSVTDERNEKRKKSLDNKVKIMEAVNMALREAKAGLHRAQDLYDTAEEANFPEENEDVLLADIVTHQATVDYIENRMAELSVEKAVIQEEIEKDERLRDLLYEYLDKMEVDQSKAS
ncbi:MAG: hypothetical protein KGZ30_03725 [Anaplasmataceae bacterium]|nr:hypothetical protein [Anaplasmataceae bacterium]